MPHSVHAVSNSSSSTSGTAPDHVLTTSVMVYSINSQQSN